MSRHQDYVFRERSQDFDHAVGFAGHVDHLANKKPPHEERKKEAFYYYGSQKRQEAGSRWLNIMHFFPLGILLAFGLSLAWGLLSILLSAIYIVVVISLEKIIKSKKIK